MPEERETGNVTNVSFFAFSVSATWADGRTSEYLDLAARSLTFSDLAGHSFTIVGVFRRGDQSKSIPLQT
jgi:hypothetical protein